jgi:hypothetical protein
MTWRDGLKAARKEYAEHLDDLPLALFLFAADPPDTRFQRGYQEGVRRMAKKHCGAIEALMAPHLATGIGRRH